MMNLADAVVGQAPQERVLESSARPPSGTAPFFVAIGDRMQTVHFGRLAKTTLSSHRPRIGVRVVNSSNGFCVCADVGEICRFEPRAVAARTSYSRVFAPFHEIEE